MVDSSPINHHSSTITYHPSLIDKMETSPEKKQKISFKERLKQMGILAFLFFLIKGLVWLAIFLGLREWLKDYFQ